MNYNNKQLVANDEQGQELCVIYIIDDQAKLAMTDVDRGEHRTQRFDTKAEYERDRMVRMMRGEL